MIKKLLLVLVALSLLIPATACSAGDDTIKIGCVLSLSGDLGPKGKDRLEAARLAVKEINAAGGVLGKELLLVDKDDATNADKCLEQVQR